MSAPTAVSSIPSSQPWKAHLTCQSQAQQLESHPRPSFLPTSCPANLVFLNQASTPEVQRNSKPKPQPSSAIHRGADCLLTLFEEERQRYEARCKARLLDLEAQFHMFRAVAWEEQQKLTTRVKQLEAELEAERKNAEALLLLQRDGDAKGWRREQGQGTREVGTGSVDAAVQTASTIPVLMAPTAVCVIDDQADSMLLEQIDGKAARLLRQLIFHVGKTIAEYQDGNASPESNSTKVGTVPDVFIPALAEYIVYHETALQDLGGKCRAGEKKRASLERKIKRKCDKIRSLDQQLQQLRCVQQRPSSRPESEDEEKDNVPRLGLVSKAQKAQALEVLLLDGQADPVVLAELDGGTMRLLRKLAVHIVQAAAQSNGETVANLTRIEALPDVFIPALAHYLVSHKRALRSLEEKCHAAEEKGDTLRRTLNKKRAKIRDLHRELFNAGNCGVWTSAYLSPATSGSESENEDKYTGEVDDDNGDNDRMHPSGIEVNPPHTPSERNAQEAEGQSITDSTGPKPNHS